MVVEINIIDERATNSQRMYWEEVFIFDTKFFLCIVSASFCTFYSICVVLKHTFLILIKGYLSRGNLTSTPISWLKMIKTSLSNQDWLHGI